MGSKVVTEEGLDLVQVTEAVLSGNCVQVGCDEGEPDTEYTEAPDIHITVGRENGSGHRTPTVLEGIQGNLVIHFCEISDMGEVLRRNDIYLDGEYFANLTATPVTIPDVAGRIVVVDLTPYPATSSYHEADNICNSETKKPTPCYIGEVM